MVGGLLMLVALAGSGAAAAPSVKITSLGSQAGELCDRATIFEDQDPREGSRMVAFVAGVANRPVHMALSGRTMGFDGDAKCVAGCP